MNDINYNTSSIASLRERVLNLSDVPTNEALRIAKKAETKKIRVQNILEKKIRSETEKFLLQTKRKILYTIKKIIDNEIEKMGGKFEKKYTEEQIEQMAFVFPRGKKMTILSVKQNFCQFELSWRQAQKIIDKNRELFPNRQNTLS